MSYIDTQIDSIRNELQKLKNDSNRNDWRVSEYNRLQKKMIELISKKTIQERNPTQPTVEESKEYGFIITVPIERIENIINAKLEDIGNNKVKITLTTYITNPTQSQTIILPNVLSVFKKGEYELNNVRYSYLKYSNGNPIIREYKGYSCFFYVIRPSVGGTSNPRKHQTKNITKRKYKIRKTIRKRKSKKTT